MIDPACSLHEAITSSHKQKARRVVGLVAS